VHYSSRLVHKILSAQKHSPNRRTTFSRTPRNIILHVQKHFADRRSGFYRLLQVNYYTFGEFFIIFHLTIHQKYNNLMYVRRINLLPPYKQRKPPQGFIILAFIGVANMAEVMENIFSRRVKDLMKENRFSQKKMCELCGITEAAFSRYMTSGRLPRTDVLANIANALNTTSDFLTGNDTHYGYEQLEILLASSKDNLSLNQKKKLVGILMDEYKTAQEV
jgi:transcriptional regulator with XRE-family HTH domain